MFQCAVILDYVPVFGDFRLCCSVLQGSMANKEGLREYYYDRQIVFC